MSSARKQAQLARRAQASAGQGSGGASSAVPAVLMQCYVDEWLTSEDHALADGQRDVVAWNRWRRARQTFADERGLTLMQAFGCVARGVAGESRPTCSARTGCATRSRATASGVRRWRRRSPRDHVAPEGRG